MNKAPARSARTPRGLRSEPSAVTVPISQRTEDAGCVGRGCRGPGVLGTLPARPAPSPHGVQTQNLPPLLIFLLRRRCRLFRISIKCGGFLLRLPGPHLTSSLAVSGYFLSRVRAHAGLCSPRVARACVGPHSAALRARRQDASGRTTPPCVRAGRPRAPASEAESVPAVARVPGISGAASLSLRPGVRTRGSLAGSGPEDAEAEVEGDAPQ